MNQSALTSELATCKVELPKLAKDVSTSCGKVLSHCDLGDTIGIHHELIVHIQSATEVKIDVCRACHSATTWSFAAITKSSYT